MCIYTYKITSVCEIPLALSTKIMKWSELPCQKSLVEALSLRLGAPKLEDPVCLEPKRREMSKKRQTTTPFCLQLEHLRRKSQPCARSRSCVDRAMIRIISAPQLSFKTGTISLPVAQRNCNPVPSPPRRSIVQVTKQISKPYKLIK